MTVVLDSRRDFTLEAARRVGAGESVRFSKRALARMTATRTSFMRLLDSDRGQFIYGVTSEAGPRAMNRIPPEKQRAHARDALRRPEGWGFGGGDLPERVVRMIVFARLANYVEGNAKTRPVIARRVAAMLDRPLPKVPLMGQVGAGEILPLFHAMSRLPEGDVQEAEPMTVVNGAPVSAALAADVALGAGHRLALAERVFALSIEAISAPLDHYDPALAAFWGDPFEAAALRSLRHLLAGVPRKGRRAYQAPVSWRILPRVLGAARRAVATMAEVAEISLSAVTDNPVYVPPDRAHPMGRVFSTGGYHNAQAYPAIDAVNANWADLCTLADRHTTKLHTAAVSHLPRGLVKPGARPWGTGLLGMIQIDFGETARHAAQRTFLPPSEGGGYGQNDVAVPTFIAYRKHLQAADCLESALAILAATASQALWSTDRDGPKRLRPFLAAVRRHVPPVHGRRSRHIGRDLARLKDAFAAAVARGDVDSVD